MPIYWRRATLLRRCRVLLRAQRPQRTPTLSPNLTLTHTHRRMRKISSFLIRSISRPHPLRRRHRMRRAVHRAVGRRTPAPDHAPAPLPALEPPPPLPLLLLRLPLRPAPDLGLALCLICTCQRQAQA